MKTPSSLLSLAVLLKQSGFPMEAKRISAMAEKEMEAAFNTNDLNNDRPQPQFTMTQNKCGSCGAFLPPVANFCPLCGNNLQNMLPSDTLQLHQPNVEQPNNELPHFAVSPSPVTQDASSIDTAIIVRPKHSKDSTPVLVLEPVSAPEPEVVVPNVFPSKEALSENDNLAMARIQAKLFLRGFDPDLIK